MSSEKFIEIIVQNHLILHGFDENNEEVLEKVKVEKWSKKMVAKDRIQSIGEKHALMSYTFERFIDWEYKKDYETLKSRLD